MVAGLPAGGEYWERGASWTNCSMRLAHIPVPCKVLIVCRMLGSGRSMSFKCSSSGSTRFARTKKRAFRLATRLF